MPSGITTDREFANRLKRLMRAKGYRGPGAPERLARAIQGHGEYLSAKSIRRMLKNSTWKPTRNSLEVLASFFEKSLDYLCFGADEDVSDTALESPDVFGQPSQPSVQPTTTLVPTAASNVLGQPSDSQDAASKNKPTKKTSIQAFRLIAAVLLLVFAWLAETSYPRWRIDDGTLVITGRFIGIPMWRGQQESPVEPGSVSRGHWKGGDVIAYGTTAVGADAGKMFVRTKRLGRTMIETRTDVDEVRDVFGDDPEARGTFGCRGIVFADMDGDGFDEIISQYTHHKWYPGYCQILWSTAREPTRYYNQGHLAKPYPYDIDNDGKKELLIAGTNNHPAYQGAVLILLDDTVRTGCARDDVSLTHARFPDCSRVRLVFPSFDADIMNEFQARRLNMQKVGANPDAEGLLITCEVDVPGDCAFVLTLNSNLEIVAPVGPSDGCKGRVRDWPDQAQRVTHNDYLAQWVATCYRFEAGERVPSRENPTNDPLGSLRVGSESAH